MMRKMALMLTMLALLGGCSRAASPIAAAPPAAAPPAIAPAAIAPPAVSPAAAPPATTPPAPNTVTPARVNLILAADGKLSSQISGDAGVAGRPVTAQDPVRIASISKLVTAIGVMRLADQRMLNLDRDVGDYLGWRLRNPAFPDRIITLRMLLSHTSGLRDGAGYSLSPDASLEQMLAMPGAWDSGHPPGAYFSYANLGSPVVAAVMEGASGEPFDQLMQRLIFKPLALDACFNWSGCSAGRRAQAVTLLRPNGDLARDPPLASGQSECVFARTSDGGCDRGQYRLGFNGSAFGPQGGLRISAQDLLIIAAVLRDGGKPLLSGAAFAEMIKPYWQFNGKNGEDLDGAFYAYGLGVDLQPGDWMGHVGDAYGLRAGLWVNRRSGEIRVRYATMVDEAQFVGSCLDICP